MICRNLKHAGRDHAKALCHECRRDEAIAQVQGHVAKMVQSGKLTPEMAERVLAKKREMQA